MLDVLNFVFSSFWVWLGCVILLGVLGKLIAITALSLYALLHRGK